MSIVGDNIKRIRTARNIFQAELGEAIHRDQRTISNWERGVRNPKPDEIRDIAKVLGVAPSEIIGHTDIADYEFEYIVPDDSMSPDLKQGDTLKVNRAIDPVDGDLVIVETDRKAQIVRRLYRIGHMLSLLAVNPSIKPINTNNDNVKIQGKVTELRRKV